MPKDGVVRWTCRVAVILLGAWALQRYVWLPYRANHVLYQIDQRTEEAQKAGPYRALPAARENLARLDTIEGVAKTQVYYQMLYATNARILQRWDLAMQHFNDALAIDPRPEIYFQRGLMLVERGQVDAAMPDLVLAVRFNPTLAETLDENLQLRLVQASPPR